MMSPRIASIPSKTMKVVALVLAEPLWYAPAANMRADMMAQHGVRAGSIWMSAGVGSDQYFAYMSDLTYTSRRESA